MSLMLSFLIQSLTRATATGYFFKALGSKRDFQAISPAAFLEILEVTSEDPAMADSIVFLLCLF